MSMLFLLQLKTNQTFFSEDTIQTTVRKFGWFLLCVYMLTRFSSLCFCTLLIFFCSFLFVSSVLCIDQSINTCRIQPFHFIQCSDNIWATIRASACPFALTLKFIIWGQCHMDHVCCRTAPLITLSQINKSCCSLRPALASLVHALHLQVKSHFKPCDNEHMLWFHCKK